MTYYCEDRLHLIACEKCGTLALTKAVSPQVAANLTLRQPTLTPPNEALICDGCLWAEMGALEKCSSCMRDKKDNYYRRPPEGEEYT